MRFSRALAIAAPALLCAGAAFWLLEAERAGTKTPAASAELASELEPGDSVAVGGACLTAAEVADGHFEADVIRQTLELTTLGALAQGDGVNLELALRASDRLGGHVVQGHVDATATVASVTDEGIARRLRVALPSDLMPYVVERGSVAIDGVSLTVVGVSDTHFDVALIPHTLAHTNLGDRHPGDRVNLEADVLGKYVVRYLERTRTV